MTEIQTHHDKIKRGHTNPYATALMRVAAEECLSTGEDAFIGILDGDGQHLIFEVHYDPDFWLTGDDESPEECAAREWVHIQVRDPQFNLSLLEIWVDLSNSRLNIDDELASEEACYGSVASKTYQVTNYLYKVLLPAIRTRIPAGENPEFYRRESKL